jgi:hypothetical protein
VCCFVLFMSESILKCPRYFLGLFVSGPEVVLELLRAARARQDKIHRKSESLTRLVELYLSLMRMLDHGTPLASTVFVSGRPEIKLVPAATACCTAILGSICGIAPHLLLLCHHSSSLLLSSSSVVVVVGFRGSHVSVLYRCAGMLLHNYRKNNSVFYWLKLVEVHVIMKRTYC